MTDHTASTRAAELCDKLGLVKTDRALRLAQDVLDARTPPDTVKEGEIERARKVIAEVNSRNAARDELPHRFFKSFSTAEIETEIEKRNGDVGVLLVAGDVLLSLIDRLRAERDEMREALEPFAKLAAYWDNERATDQTEVWLDGACGLIVADLRRARRAAVHPAYEQTAEQPAPIRTCSGYHSRVLSGACTNCGKPKSAHFATALRPTQETKK